MSAETKEKVSSAHILVITADEERRHHTDDRCKRATNREISTLSEHFMGWRSKDGAGMIKANVS